MKSKCSRLIREYQVSRNEVVYKFLIFYLQNIDSEEMINTNFLKYMIYERNGTQF